MEAKLGCAACKDAPLSPVERNHPSTRVCEAYTLQVAMHRHCETHHKTTSLLRAEGEATMHVQFEHTTYA